MRLTRFKVNNRRTFEWGCLHRLRCSWYLPDLTYVSRPLGHDLVHCTSNANGKSELLQYIST
jgi:hypothetical protein